MNNCMHYLSLHIRIDQRSGCHCPIVFHEIINFTTARYTAIFVLLITYMGANVHWHFIGRDYGNFLLSYIDNLLLMTFGSPSCFPFK